jgi:hypothetical protein
MSPEHDPERWKPVFDKVMLDERIGLECDSMQIGSDSSSR